MFRLVLGFGVVDARVVYGLVLGLIVCCRGLLCAYVFVCLWFGFVVWVALCRLLFELVV